MAFRLNRKTAALVTLFSLAWHSTAAHAAGDSYQLEASLKPGDQALVEVSLEVGGQLVVKDAEGHEVKLPMSAVGKLAFQDHLLSWSVDSAEPMRALRRYHSAEATLKSDKAGSQRHLPVEKQLIVAELSGGRLFANGLHEPLTREEADLIDTMGDVLAIDRLLPNKAVADGESWSHDGEVIAALLGMDHVAACQVESKVTGKSHGQVQIRLSGTANGTIDGAATEIELQAAYLFHPGRGRITKFNLAVRENRQPGDASPGLHATAKLNLHIVPADAHAEDGPSFSADEIDQAAAFSQPELRQLLVDAPQRGFRFRHDAMWIVTAEQRELMSLRLLQQGRLIAHCNVSAIPASSAGKSPTLAAFEQDVRRSLGDKAEQVAAAKEWKSSTGHRCLGVFINGKVEDAPIQWRYYLVLGNDLPPASVSVTLEQERIPDFADADRLIVDSLELIAKPDGDDAPVGKTAVGETARRGTRQQSGR